MLDSNDTKFDFAEQCFQLYKVHYKGLMAIDENKYSRILLDKDELYKAFYPHIIEEAKSCLSYLSKQRQYDHLGRSTCRAFKLLEEVYETYKFNLGDINVSKKWYLETSKEIYGQYIAYLITEGFENPKKADKIVAQIEQLAEKHHIDLTNMSVSKSLYQ
ncbi:MAG TPA: hypothetical protein DCL21_02855 [Alphaproteobacteria bacterium]|nr:hypothetical protein [Alphaproteobacteria bacterium]